VILRGDEVDYNDDTGEIVEARISGNSRGDLAYF
jgi:hypothetical protein